jgi:dTDP-4-dehydrorhamnose reductase
MRNERVLITGTTGMLGRQFLEVFKSRYKDVRTLNRSDGNLLDFKFVSDFVESIDPDIIVHCIADTNLKRCETDRENTLLLHCGLTDCLASHTSRFIYISSDSTMNPVNFYAKTKYLGEKITCFNNPNSVILRTNIYGFNSSSGNSLVEWALNSFKKAETINGFSDVMFNAIYTKQLVDTAYDIINSDVTGIIDVGGNYTISKFDFLKRVCSTFNYNVDLLEEGKLSDMNIGVDRPKNTLLDIKELNDKFGIVLNLEDGLKQLKIDMEIYERNNN